MIGPSLKYRVSFERETKRRPLIRVSPMASLVVFDIEYDAATLQEMDMPPSAASKYGGSTQFIEALATDKVLKAVPRSRYKRLHAEQRP